MTRRRRVLVVSTFPPRKCGIATYAEEQVSWLKSQGDLVQTYSFESDCGASYRLNTYSLGALLRGFLLFFLFRFRFDLVYVHYAADFFYPWLSFGGRKKVLVRLAQAAFLWWIGFWLGRRSYLIVHELSASPNHSPWNRRLRGMAIAAFHRVQFHTAKEQSECLEFYKAVRLKQTEVVDHERFMQPKYFGNRARARADLGLPDDKVIFVCLGFIQDHKGFDAAVDAMGSLNDPEKMLYIVGSVREPKPEFLSYRDHLAREVAKHRNVRLVETFVTDLEFDCWIRAADCVVLPYRHIQSSGVAARSLVLGTPMLINSNSNLANQLRGRPSVTGFSDTADLSLQFANFKVSPELDVHTVGLSSTSSGTPAKTEQDSRKPILFIMPWFGPKIKGGAEKFIYELASELVVRGSQVEVWSTDSSELMGRNHTLAGSKETNGDSEAPFVIRRFPSNPKFERLFNWAHGRMHDPRKSNGLVRWIWKKTAFNGLGMRDALTARHQNFSSVHLCHYFSGSTHSLHDVAPEKTFLHAFVHDEPLAFSGVMRPVFAHARGILGNTPAEYEVAFRGPAAVPSRFFAAIGNGVRLPEFDAALLSPERRLPKRKRQIAFVGRLIAEKGLRELVDWLDSDPSVSEDSSLSLVCVGEGPLKGYRGPTGRAKISYTGWVSEEEKRRILGESICLVLLSRLESFSFVLMESWLELTPVIVHRDCPATRQHVEVSGGGFAVGSREEFLSALGVLSCDDGLVGLLGASGMTYVRKNYSWDRVVQNFHDARNRLMGWYSEPTTRADGELSGGFSSVSSGHRSPDELFKVRWMDRIPGLSSMCGPVIFRALDGVIARSAPSPESQLINRVLGSDFYACFEDAFRGKKVDGEASTSWQLYRELCSSLAPGSLWLDVGAGQGDLITYLSSGSHLPIENFFGVEPDTASYLRMRSRGILCASCDGSALMERLPAESMDVVSLIQVAEHLDLSSLIELLQHCGRVLRPGGLLLIEWPCLFSIKTSAVSYWQDPTHQRPLHPFALDFMVQRVGFSSTELRYFAPWQEELPAEYPDPLRIVWNDLYRSQDALLIARC